MADRPETTLTKREKGMLRHRSCGFCEARLTAPATGRCGAIWKPAHGDAACGWVRAIRALGVEEAIRQSRLPLEQRSQV